MFDFIIIGAGIFGLYAAEILTKKGAKVCIIEKGLKPFSRASAINQARVHNGYHYPRSYDTASKAAYYYERFTRDFNFAINDSFKQIYAVAREGSRTTKEEFVDFCHSVHIPLLPLNAGMYFKKGSVEDAFLTKECAFDWQKVRDYLLHQIGTDASFFYDTEITRVLIEENQYRLETNNKNCLRAPIVINATYANVNKIIRLFNQDAFDLKYELCEISLCTACPALKDIGITVIDGQYFSIMPFGNEKLHSMTAVEQTPRSVCYDIAPSFSSAGSREVCQSHQTRACEICPAPVASTSNKMNLLAHRFLKDDFKITHKRSLFEIKAILKSSEDDDSRPTIIRRHRRKPDFISILSGKISSIYDLEIFFKNF